MVGLVLRIGLLRSGPPRPAAVPRRSPPHAADDSGACAEYGSCYMWPAILGVAFVIVLVLTIGSVVVILSKRRRARREMLRRERVGGAGRVMAQPAPPPVVPPAYPAAAPEYAMPLPQLGAGELDPAPPSYDDAVASAMQPVAVLKGMQDEETAI